MNILATSQGEVVKAGQIQGYMTSIFYDILGHYQLTKLIGNPNGSVGYLNENIGFVYAYLAFEQEESAIQAEDRRKQEIESKAKQKPSSSKKGRRRK